MLVYGDHDRAADPRQAWKALGRDCAEVWTMPPGLDRHAKLVALLTEAGRLLQGVADADFDEAACDRCSPATTAIAMTMHSLARSVCTSWDSGFAELSCAPDFRAPAPLPGEVRLRIPEGFAFYAVYPEAYIDAARRLSLTAPPRVIGIRSIGTSLAAVAAAALGAPPPVTVRPVGDPFERRISVSRELARDLLSGNAHFVIVDEGPGQSGSSFAAVAGWLSDNGVPDDRIALLPSHAGPPGPAASEERHCWWSTVQREVADFADRWSALIGSWFAERIGPIDEVAQDISGGAWRALHYRRDSEWPAVVPAWERRKFLVCSGGERFLVKFAGLGRTGEAKLAIARALHLEGLTPEPVGLMHGFLVERWCEDTTPIRPHDKPVREIARYIGTRAKLLPAMSGSGASADELLTMIRRNVSVEFGPGFASAIDAWNAHAGELERPIVRVRSDNRMQPHEWLRSPAGALIKTDALDHHSGHDLVGCQDVAWDVAGAICEFALGPGEQSAFIAAVEESANRSVDRELLAFYRAAYAAFRLGQARLGAEMTADDAERRRLRRDGDRYAAELQHLLERGSCATRLTSLVG